MFDDQDVKTALRTFDPGVRVDVRAVVQQGRRIKQRRLAVGATAAVAALAVGVTGTQFASHSDRLTGDLAATVIAGRLPANTNVVGSVVLSTTINEVVSKLAAGGFAWSRTADGGHTWDTRKLPSSLANPHAVVALDAQTTMVGNLITHDGGETWSVRPAAGAAVRSLPTQWQLLTPLSTDALLAQPAANASAGELAAGPVAKAGQPPTVPMAVDPGSGQLHPLGTAARGCLPTNERQPTNGSLWLEAMARSPSAATAARPGTRSTPRRRKAPVASTLPRMDRNTRIGRSPWTASTAIPDMPWWSTFLVRRCSFAPPTVA
ncbi:beta propeller repeat protein [Fodinicola feengrottensis]|uniref:hypothetical protein n=1 Tax=Fodinicola feengrottensis TaxID=435914 RepID=UPI0013D7491F|nr:hypothetical protein [Fodinicola feengrottensis]